MADSAATMTREQVLEEFRQAGALLHGHFILSSGLRSPTDLQCARVLMAEDVVTTGKSSRDCIACIVAGGGSVVAASCLIDHRDGAVDLGAPLIALACLAAPVYEPDSLPLAAVPAVKPGSRISP